MIPEAWKYITWPELDACGVEGLGETDLERKALHDILGSSGCICNGG